MNNLKYKTNPGVYIEDAIELLNLTIDEFSEESGIDRNILKNLINKKESITYDLALKLSNYFNNSIDVWIKLQKAYDNAINNL